MENKNIFITGATGFIGENLAFKLAEKNQVFALVRPESIKKTTRLKEQGIEIVCGDLLDNNSYSKRLNNIDYVFHLAALFKLEASKDELYKYNVLGTKTLLESYLHKDIKKIIYFSTAYVAGTKEKELISEDESYPKNFKNWYEWSKAEGEKIALQFFKEYNLPVTVVRPAIVYGSGSLYGFYNALNLISRKKLFMLPGNGRNKVHLVHVDDVVRAVIHLANREEAIGKIYHISDDHPYTCDDLIKMLCRQLNVKPPVAHLPRFFAKALIRIPLCKPFFGRISPQLLDYFLYSQSYSNQKLKNIKYTLQYPSLKDNLELIIDWYRDNNYLG